MLEFIFPYWGAVQERLTLDKIREIAQLSNYRYSSLLLFNEFEIAYDSSDYVEILRDSIYSHVLNRSLAKVVIASSSGLPVQRLS